MANGKKIYIVPSSGAYDGKVIALDHVEGFNWKSSSSISQHPVESQNQNIADHRFHQAKTISMSGMVSDEWNTNIVYEPTPVFQTTYKKQQKSLRTTVADAYGKNSDVYRIVTSILDKEVTNINNFNTNKINTLPEDQQNYVFEAFDLVTAEQDVIDISQDKGQSITQADDNLTYVNNALNSIVQVKEALQYFDDNDTILTIVSLRDTYENMVLVEFNNVLRNGPERGAYWVNLLFKEELIATGVTNRTIVSSENSEEVDDKKTKGKSDPEEDINSVFVERVNEIYDDVKDKHPSNNGINNKDLDYWLNKASGTQPNAAESFIKEKAYDEYSNSQSDANTENVIFSYFTSLAASRGNPKWKGYSVPK